MPSQMTLFASALTAYSYSIRLGIVTPTAAGNLPWSQASSHPASKRCTCRYTSAPTNRMTSPGSIFSSFTPVEADARVRVCPGLARG